MKNRSNPEEVIFLKEQETHQFTENIYETENVLNTDITCNASPDSQARASKHLISIIPDLSTQKKNQELNFLDRKFMEIKRWEEQRHDSKS